MKSTEQHIDVMVVDMQGNLRGKWIPIDQQSKVLDGQVRLPVSTQVQDIWGDDNDNLTGMGPDAGDPDGLCVPINAQLIETPWNPGSQQILCSMQSVAGENMFCDPRSILANVLEKFTVRGLTPVVAVELEFYLLDTPSVVAGVPAPPPHINIAGQIKPYQVYDMRVMDRAEPTLKLIHEYAKALNIPSDASLAEIGPGQFEINLMHCDNAVQAADEAVLFKRVVDRAAIDSNMTATFMAKPYTEHTGNGLHVHVSLLDNEGNNIFDQANNENNLVWAANGLLETMKDAQGILAPHGNSYKRLQPDSFAPVQMSWGHDHRGVAVRLPETHGKAARLEHRVAGADANPYLALAAILSGILHGLDKGAKPKLPALSPGETSSAEFLHHDWLNAVNQFSESEFIKHTVGEKYQRLFANVKRFEAITINKTVDQLDWLTYLPRL